MGDDGTPTTRRKNQSVPLASRVLVRLPCMSHDVNAEATTMPRAFGWAMLLLTVAVAVTGVSLIAGAAGWWDVATGAVALVGAAVLAFRGVKSLRRPS